MEQVYEGNSSEDPVFQGQGRNARIWSFQIYVIQPRQKIPQKVLSLDRT